MYVDGVGIIYWDPSTLTPEGFHDAMHPVLFDTVIIPGTGYHRSRNSIDESDLGRNFGGVTNHIVLEGYIVFITDLNKIFSYRTAFPLAKDSRPEPVELTTFYPMLPPPVGISDVQGSFRSFAVFAQSGSILRASCSFLDAAHSADILLQPIITPAPQGKSIISIAFGDHHYHALHKNGTTTSYGTESGQCGAFGLGTGAGLALRGATCPNRRDWRLEMDEARTVWFEPLMWTWLRETYENWVIPSRSMEISDSEARKAYGDYFEREGARWEEGITGEGELGAYFVLKVSAGGWHSAALVLVDEEKAEQARKKQIVRSSPEENDKQPRPPSPSVEPSPNAWRSWLFGLLITWARWFLGLTARDLAATTSDGSQRRDTVQRRRLDQARLEVIQPRANPALEPYAAANTVPYRWRRQALPSQLRLGIGPGPF
jgi:SCF-associated factor 1